MTFFREGYMGGQVDLGKAGRLQWIDGIAEVWAELNGAITRTLYIFTLMKLNP